MVDGYPHRTWCDAGGRALIEDYEITGLAHGIPLATRGEGAVGEAGPHMLEAGISSTRHIAGFWAIAGRLNGKALRGSAADRQPELTAIAQQHSTSAPVSGTGVDKIIRDALRAAGLMR